MEKEREGGREGVGPQDDERKMKMKDLDLAFEHGVGFWHLMMVRHNNLAKLSNRFKGASVNNGWHCSNTSHRI